jgi:hypothetical protein
MKETFKFDELIGCAGILASGSWADPIGTDGFPPAPLLST